MKTILTLDGDGYDLETLGDLLRGHGYAVDTVIECAEAMLRFNRFAVDKMKDQAFWVSPEGRLLYVNEAACRTLGYSREELLGMSIFDIDPDCTFEEYTRLWKDLQTNGSFSLESFHRCKDGRVYPVEIRSNFMKFEGKEYNCAFITDISERKRADEALRFTQYVVDNTTDQAFWLTSDAKVFYVNDAACRALGYTRDELVGMSIHDFDPVYPANEFKKGWELLRNEKSRIIESWHRSKDGRVYPVEVRVNHVEFDGKEYHCTFVTDISERKATEEIRRQSEQRYRQLMEILPIAAYTTDADGRITFFNRNAVELWGRKPELNVDRWCGSHRLWYPDGRPMALVDCPMAMTLKYGKKFQGQEVLVEHAKSGYSHVVAYPEPLYDSDGKLVGALNLLVDITQRKQVEKQLLQSNIVVENSPVVLFRWKNEPGWPVVLVSKNITQFGYEPEELLSGTLAFSSMIHPGDRERVVREVEIYAARGVDRFEQEYRILGKGGRNCWVSDQTIVERNDEGQITHYQGIVIDITERKHAEERIKASLREKEVLLKEIHHRVKNNLQVVSSLLYLQSQKLQDAEARALFVESQNRICSMALAHEQLYKSHNLADVSLTDYVQNLVSHVQQAYMKQETHHECRVVIDNVELDIEKVVPCGLLITELLSNVFKHAFPDARCGAIEVTLSKQSGRLLLSVADDGVGLPESLDYRNAQTLGLQLVSALVEQLDGSLSVKNDAGTRFAISFPG
ncbi:MAG: PAS domain S-box protein [Pedobacter sp.]